MGHLLVLMTCVIILIKLGILLVERHAVTLTNGLLWVALLLFTAGIAIDWMLNEVNRSAK